MALGAEPGGILRMILGEGAMMAAIGLVIGGVVAAACRDGGSLGAGRRAMTVDPMTVLRRE